MVIPEPEETSRKASTGVTKVPTRLEVVAETIAPGTLPWAIEVKLIEDCTVEGTRVSQSSPRYSTGEMAQGVSTRRAMPTSGNTTKVQARIVRCSRQCCSPWRVSRGSSLAP